MKKKIYKEIDVPKSGKKVWYDGAYVLAFVYSKTGNYVVKGFFKEVEEYIKQNYTHYFVNYSLWYQGAHRDIWKFWKDDVIILYPKFNAKNRLLHKWRVRRCSTGYESREETKKTNKEALSFKRIPNKWIPEFEKF